MKLYNVPRNSKILLNDGLVLNFHHVDGMYSVCTDDNGEIFHIRSVEEVEIVEENNESKSRAEDCND